MFRCMKIAKTTASNKVQWQERVRAWRESGKSAREFAQGQAFAASTLRYWSSRLERNQAPRFVRLVPKPAVTAVGSGLVVEVGSARVRVGSGFDPLLLAQVVRALGTEAR
jgi:hypothetical protein